MNPFSRALKRLLGQPDFVVVVLLLGTGAVTLNFVTRYLQLHYRKLPLPLRVAALGAPDGMPAVLGPWVQISRDESIDKDIEHVLGTSQYCFRVYLDSRKISREQIDDIKAMPPEQQAAALAQIKRLQPEALLRADLTYYTGKVDTVAHIPDRCDIADGYEPSSYQTIEQKLACADGRERAVPFRYINFDDQTGTGRFSRNVAYLFHVNGEYKSDPLGVRWKLQDLRERYGYYAKVELMTESPAEVAPDLKKAIQDRSLAAMEDFLSEALPEVERCLPDWQKVHSAPAK